MCEAAGHPALKLVRRMCEAIGHPVLKLVRIRIGDFELGDIPVGKFKNLEAPDLRKLLSVRIRSQ